LEEAVSLGKGTTGGKKVTDSHVMGGSRQLIRGGKNVLMGAVEKNMD